MEKEKIKPVFRRLQIPNIKAPNFEMNPLELKDFIDFEVKRIYFITKPTGPTGAHCHKVEKELFVMVAGSCTAEIDDGNGLREIELRAPTDAIYVDAYVWHHFKNFSPEAVLLALSSTNYNPDRSDYIENYDEYRQTIGQ